MDIKSFLKSRGYYMGGSQRVDFLCERLNDELKFEYVAVEWKHRNAEVILRDVENFASAIEKIKKEKYREGALVNAILFAASKFTPEAEEFARKKKIILVGSKNLAKFYSKPPEFLERKSKNPFNASRCLFS